MNPIRGSLENNHNLRLSRSIKKDLYLPPIHKQQLAPATHANLLTARSWSNSTKQLIAKEWDNLQKIKERGTLSPKYTVLPPITHKTLLKNDAGLHHNASLKDNNQHVIQLKRMIELTTEPIDEPAQQSHHDIQQRKSRHSHRNKHKQQGSNRTDRKDEPSTTSMSINTNKKQNTNSVQLPHIPTQNNTIPQPNEITTREIKSQQKPTEMIKLPEVFSPDQSRGRKREQLENKFNENMIAWTRQQGRRNAICYEIDPMFQELTSIIKYNLLVQHLEDIWMC
jgi:hypothetical protein